jgi:hypothetical protein
MIMMIRNIIECMAFVFLTFALLLAVNSRVQANDDFSIRLTMNGDDISEMETIVIDPERELTIDLQIFDVTRDVTLQKVSVLVTFAEQVILTQSETLGNFQMVAGESYRRGITINAREILKFGDRPLSTGIYRSQVRLEYVVDGREKAWSQWKNIQILGNPLSTPAGAAGIVVSAGALAAILLVVRALAVPNLPAGTALPSSTPVKALPRLYEFALERLEPMARGRVVGSIVNSAKKRIIKERCPICETRLKHGHCYTCKKSVKEVRKEYTNKLKDLVLQGGQLIASGQAATLDDVCSRLGISGKLGTDVIAILRHAKLVRVKGLARKLTGKAITAGIGSGLSAIIWVTVGGFAVLSTSALIGILIASVVIPLTVTKSLQVKARRAIRRSAN